MLIRNPYDTYERGGFANPPWKVVPATFWHNDLVAANGIFPSSGGSDPANHVWGITSYNVDCPNDGTNGFFDIEPRCDTDPGTGENSPWRYASTGYIIGDALEHVFPDWDDVQSSDWGWGVFYPTDSNSVDFRCRWLGDYGIWDCPPDPGGNWHGGWISTDGSWTQDDSKLGPGAFDMGNPFADGSKGGGTGCHFNKRGTIMMIDQTDADDGNGHNLVQNEDCECNYAFADDWSHWVQTWMYRAQVKPGLEDEDWLGAGGKKAPNRALDQVTCWVNNFRDMIWMQNHIWWNRWTWNNQQAPQQNWQPDDPNSFWGYWGWNEIPTDLSSLTPHENHQTIFIHLPSSICGNGGGDDSVSCLGEGQQKALENDLDNWVNGPDQFGYLVTGEENMGNRPGSYIVFVREWYDVPNDRWRKYFFCENWNGPLGKYKIVSYAMDPSSGYDGACFLERGSQYHRYYGNATNLGQLRHTMDEFV